MNGRDKSNSKKFVIVGGSQADKGNPDITITVEDCDEETGKANAYLIAAVPDLYKTLKDIVKARGMCVLSANDPVDREFDRVAVMARAVIDELEGAIADA